jgi:hypothetical protein
MFRAFIAGTRRLCSTAEVTTTLIHAVGIETRTGSVRRLIGIEVGVVSRVFNLESPGVDAPGLETTP